MTDDTRVLYLTSDRTTAGAVESLLATERPDLALSSVTSVADATDALEAGGIDCVVVDAAHGTDGSARSTSATDSGDSPPSDSAADLRTVSDVPVETVGYDADASDYERVRVLAHQIADAATPALAERGGRGDGSTNAGRGDGSAGGAYFRALAQTVSDAILVIDADSVVRFTNPAIEDVFGYEPAELVGESLTRLMPERLRGRHREGILRYLREGDRRLDWSYLELTGRHRDGREIPLGVSFSEFVRDGELLFTGVVRDISERKDRETELRRRVRQQRGVAEFSQLALEDRPLADLFDEAVELVADTLDHDYCKVLELRPERGDLLLRAGVGWREGIVGSATVADDRGSQAGYTLLAEEPVVVEDLPNEERFSGPELLTSHDVTSGISTVIGTPDRPWGILGTHDTESRSYADHDVQFVQSVAHILATAIRRHQRERDLERYEAMVEAVDDGLYALDAEGRFVAVNDAYCELTGYARDRLLGERAAAVTDGALHDEGDRAQATLEAETDVMTVESTLSTADGREIPVETRISPLALGDGSYGRVGAVRDVSDRKRREEKLTSLHGLMQSLADAESGGEICELAAAAAVETLGFENAVIALYDDDAGMLAPTVQRWPGADSIDAALLGTGGDDVAWRTFVESETRLLDDLREALDADATMGSALAVPLGRHGVFVAAGREAGAFDETDASLADILCSNVRSALDRGEREATLRDQRNTLREKNRELERVNRLNRVIREMTKVLTNASTEAEVLQAVCDRLADSGPYRFAWFGEHDGATGAVRPRTWAGVEDGYLQEISITADESESGKGPSGRAIRTRELQAQADLLGDPPFEPWREQALKRGYRSSVSIPITYGDTLHGVLNLYASEPGVFDETEQAVLAELGETIGYALNAIERREALVSERSIDLDFRLRDEDDPVLSFVAETGGEIEFENVVQRSDGHLHAFVTLRGIDSGEAMELAEGMPRIEGVRLVADRGDEILYEVTLGRESLFSSLVDRGAMTRSITVTGDEAQFVVRIPQGADVRTVVDLFEGEFEEVELVARRERDEPVMTRTEFESEFEERLTERQREVLELAYFSGYFEWPRESTAEDIAEMLDVSQPTVSRHVRGAERSLFSLLFEGP